MILWSKELVSGVSSTHVLFSIHLFLVILINCEVLFKRLFRCLIFVSPALLPLCFCHGEQRLCELRSRERRSLFGAGGLLSWHQKQNPWHVPRHPLLQRKTDCKEWPLASFCCLVWWNLEMTMRRSKQRSDGICAAFNLYTEVYKWENSTRNSHNVRTPDRPRPQKPTWLTFTCKAAEINFIC